MPKGNNKALEENIVLVDANAWTFPVPYQSFIFFATFLRGR